MQELLMAQVLPIKLSNNCGTNYHVYILLIYFIVPHQTRFSNFCKAYCSLFVFVINMKNGIASILHRTVLNL